MAYEGIKVLRRLTGRPSEAVANLFAACQFYLAQIVVAPATFGAAVHLRASASRAAASADPGRTLVSDGRLVLFPRAEDHGEATGPVQHRTEPPALR